MKNHAMRCIFYQFLRKLVSSSCMLLLEVLVISTSSKFRFFRMKISSSCFSFIFISSTKASTLFEVSLSLFVFLASSLLDGCDAYFYLVGLLFGLDQFSEKYYFSLFLSLLLRQQFR